MIQGYIFLPFCLICTPGKNLGDDFIKKKEGKRKKGRKKKCRGKGFEGRKFSEVCLRFMNIYHGMMRNQSKYFYFLKQESF